MNLIPLNNNVIVKNETQKTNNGEFFYSHQNNNDLQTAIVVSSCNEKIKGENKVIFFKYSACPYTLNGENFYIVNADDILAIVEDKNE